MRFRYGSSPARFKCSIISVAITSSSGSGAIFGCLVMRVGRGSLYSFFYCCKMFHFAFFLCVLFAFIFLVFVVIIVTSEEYYSTISCSGGNMFSTSPSMNIIPSGTPTDRFYMTQDTTLTHVLSIYIWNERATGTLITWLVAAAGDGLLTASMLPIWTVPRASLQTKFCPVRVPNVYCIECIFMRL